jgi:hypothetical protein
MAYLSWGQSFKDSIIVTVPMLLWMFFFYLLYAKISLNSIEKIILIYGVIYILLFFYQFTHSQTVIFGKKQEFMLRGITRILFSGGGIFFLSIFMAINKLTSKNNEKLFWVILSIFGIIIPILQVTRQYIAGVFILYLFHFIRNLSFPRKLIIITFFIGFLFYIRNSNSVIFTGLIEAQEENLQKGMDYIRIVSGTYFITEFSPHYINKLFGNGLPRGKVSNYGKFVDSLKSEGLHMSDVGIIGFYAMFGILAVIGYILIWIKSFSLALPKNYYYLKYYLWFLLLTSLTSDNIYSYDYLIATVFVLYLYHSLSLRHMKQDKIIDHNNNELIDFRQTPYQRKIIF